MLMLQLPQACGCQEAALLLVGGAAFFLEPALRLLLRTTVDGPLYESVRVEPMLSCIVAGFLLCNQLGQRQKFSALPHSVMRPALCFFFVTTGSSMQLSVLRHTWPMTLGLCGSRTAALWCGSFFGSVCGGASRESRTLGWLAYVTQAGVSLGLTDEIVAKFPGWGHRLQVAHRHPHTHPTQDSRLTDSPADSVTRVRRRLSCRPSCSTNCWGHPRSSTLCAQREKTGAQTGWRRTR